MAWLSLNSLVTRLRLANAEQLTTRVGYILIMENRMRTYQRYERGITPAGAIVIRFYLSGDEIRAYLREVEDEETVDTIFPGEELEPAVALRLAENKRQNSPGLPIYIELTEGVEWNPAWAEEDQTE